MADWKTRFVILFMLLAAPIAAKCVEVVVDTTGKEAWAVYRVAAEDAWVEYLAATAPALAIYNAELLIDSAMAKANYKRAERPHRAVYFARLDASDAVYEAARLLDKKKE